MDYYYDYILRLFLNEFVYSGAPEKSDICLTGVQDLAAVAK